MTVSYGFYNSVAGDRKYNATQMSKLFDGIITDGILSAVGTSLAVTPGTGMQVQVGVGRAWFNGTWTDNDSELPVNIDVSEIGFDRIDVVVLEVDTSEEVRANSIKVVKGEPSLTPVPPTLTNEDTKHQYPLAHIYVAAGVSEILEVNITSKIDTEECPIAGGILETLNTQAWKTDYNALVATINNLTNRINAKEEADVGIIFYVDDEDAPDGSVEANGAEVSRITYARLFAKIGTRHGIGNGTTTFNLPDGRGTVPRGLDNGRGYDPGRVLGSYQTDDNKEHDHGGYTDYDTHAHQYNDMYDMYTGTQSPTGGMSTYIDNTDHSRTTGTNTHRHGIAKNGTTEARMKNTAWLCCVKY